MEGDIKGIRGYISNSFDMPLSKIPVETLTREEWQRNGEGIVVIDNYPLDVEPEDLRLY